jgi:methylenetetrahydrofolate dehydrogenase (NADP+)/methenyltetrahydrofolate cyclohydrolase
MVILDGQKLSLKLLDSIKKEIDEKKLKLKLAVVLVGKNSVSNSYINKKQEASSNVGIDFEFFSFKEDINEEKLKEEIKKISNTEDISGVVIQLPLPKKFNTQEILNLIPIEKDPDVLSENAFNRFLNNQTDVFPPVVEAVKYLLEEYNIDIKGKKIALVGKGRLVGRPLAVWLKNLGADFSIIDRSIEDIASVTKEADMIISGAGSAGIIKSDMVKDGAILIDAGTSSEDGEVKGDIDKSAYEKASYVAPVPGGVGPMTVSCLLENILKTNNR